MPSAPAAICSLAIAAVLWVLACGRAPRPKPFSRDCMVAMFDSSASRSTHSAGVSRSHFDMPTPFSIARAASAAV